MIGKWLGLPRVVVVNIPSTQTMIAFALVLALWHILTAGVKAVDPDIIDLVSSLLTLIVGYYFAKASDIRNETRDRMLLSAGTGGPPPPEPGTATITAAADVNVDATVTDKPAQ